MNRLSIKQQRGFSSNPFCYASGFVFVKNNIDLVSHSLSELLDGLVVQDVYTNFQEVNSEGLLVWQYIGHNWTMFKYFLCQPNVAKKLSEKLNTDCISFQYEDTSGWTKCCFYRNGVNSETYSFGLDYREERGYWLEESGEKVIQTDCGVSWDLNVRDEERDYQFLFRSTLRSVTEKEVKQPTEFLNNFFISQNAWLPADMDTIPWFNENGFLSIEQSIFVRVDWLEFR